jgi:hypothetical protein
VTTRAERRIQIAIYAAVNQYLQEYMLRLAMLPKPPKQGKRTSQVGSPMQKSTTLTERVSPIPVKRRATISALSEGLSSPHPSPRSNLSSAPVITSASVEEDDHYITATRKHKEEHEQAKRLRQHLQELRDQKVRVEEYIQQASEKRKLEEVEMLKGNLEEISNEIERVRTELSLMSVKVDDSGEVIEDGAINLLDLLG